MSRRPPADVWLHGASVGDARALAPLVRALADARPDLRLLISAQTSTGRAMARRLFPALPVVRPPLDLPPLPDRALAQVRPRLVVLEYLELWPAWAAACRRRGVPVLVVDGRVTARSLRVRPLLRRAAAGLAAFCARTEADAAAARALGVPAERVVVHGNGKHDGVALAPPQPSPELQAAVGAVDVVIGSLHPDEEAAALPALAASGLRALIAPRYPRRAAAIVRAGDRLGVSVALRSAGGSRDARWVVLDTVGELAGAYALGAVAVVGGTFGRREGQTLAEPAAHGRPVVHGPRVANVADEVAALTGHGVAEAPDWTVAFARARVWRDAAERPDPRPALARLSGATARNLRTLLAVLEGRGVQDVDRAAGGC